MRALLVFGSVENFAPSSFGHVIHVFVNKLLFRLMFCLFQSVLHCCTVCGQYINNICITVVRNMTLNCYLNRYMFV